MRDFQLGELVWILSFEDDFYLLSKQTIVEILEDHVECEDDYNTFHVAFDDIYRNKEEALKEMISRLQEMQ